MTCRWSAFLLQGCRGEGDADRESHVILPAEMQQDTIPWLAVELSSEKRCWKVEVVQETIPVIEHRQ
jgi:hypothetical protein